MPAKLLAAAAILSLGGWAAILYLPPRGDAPMANAFPDPVPNAPVGDSETATFAGGCFWCTEAVFLELKGVKSVVSGYTGGQVKNPTYEQVCGGRTGHAEAIQIVFDPRVISFEELLAIHWRTHDPTTLNRQGNDVGPQYRSAVFSQSPKQKELAEAYKKRINDEKVFDEPIVTEIVPAAEFYAAEDYHQNFWARNPNQGYCRAIIPAKLEKLRKVFGDKVKK
jgi:peptide-methionine (S)-S-oxide reductase